VRLSVNYTRPAPPAEPADKDKAKQEAYSKELNEFNNTTAANAATADKLNARLSKWTYVISSYSADNLLIPRDKLVKAKEELKKPETSAKP
jgi:hypothetical protein